ncbi:MAG: hypothetical protein QOC80_40, partial [Frankiaceae bacterium]|nr:hypothetical protein [Frankiaceae bacterium]
MTTPQKLVPSLARRRLLARLTALRPLLVGAAVLVLAGVAAWVV